jgi:uncharacterized membrane protein YdjX (TVP38/TMEM64 family)
VKNHRGGIAVNKISWFKLVLIAVCSSIIGVVITGLLNLFSPVNNIALTIIAICLSSVASSLVGYMLGRQEKAPKNQ